jgi:hypothetical protein
MRRETNAEKFTRGPSGKKPTDVPANDTVGVAELDFPQGLVVIVIIVERFAEEILQRAVSGNL